MVKVISGFFTQQIYGSVMIDSIDKFYDFIDKADDDA
jgi:hypothetical protein